MKDLLVSMANHYWLDKFKSIKGVDTAKFFIQQDRLRLAVNIDLESVSKVDLSKDRGISDRKINDAVDKWMEIEDRIQGLARELEDQIETDEMIWTYVDRKRN